MYASINAALAALGPNGPHTITVTGTCVENVYIYKSDNITIAGQSGAVVDGTPWDAFDIEQSQGVILSGLEVRGDPAASIGVAVYGHSHANVMNCNIHDTGSGVYVDDHSGVLIRGTTIQNILQGDGIDVLNYSTANIGRSTLQGSAIGVYAQNYAEVSFTGLNSVLNNGDYGVYAIDFSRVAFSGSGTNFTTIQGHNANGIFLARESLLVMNGPQMVQGNGAACGPPTCGGITAFRNSTLRINGASITGNSGAGVYVEQGTDIGISSANITNNTGDGVRLQRMSVGDFLSISGITDNVISGNLGASVYCDRTSLAVGDLGALPKLDCKNIERPNGQVRPGKTKDPNP